MLGGGLAVLFQQADDSRADYHAVGERGHGVRLFGRGYAEADGAGQVGVFAYGGDHGREVRVYRTAHARHTQAGHDVDEALSLGRYARGAAERGGRDHGYLRHAVLAAHGRELVLFLERHVGEDEPVYAQLRALGYETPGAVREHDVGVGHEHEGDGHVAAQLSDQLERPVRRHAALERAHVGGLDDGAFGGGVGEGYAQLDEVRAALNRRAHRRRGGLEVGVAAGDEGYERLARRECFCYTVTHGCLLLCNALSPRSPCRRARIS